MKPTIMILGSGHLANWGADAFNYRMDDVLAPKRQTELQQLAEQLARFKPTKIAVEVDTRWDAELQKEYDAYLKGNFQLKPHEIHQIGFRLAKEMEHSKVYCVDYLRDDPIVREDRDDHLTDYRAFAEANEQEHLLGPPPTGKMTQDEEGTVWIEPEKYEPIVDMYIRMNQDEKIRTNPPRLLKDRPNRSTRRVPGGRIGSHIFGILGISKLSSTSPELRNQKMSVFC